MELLYPNKKHQTFDKLQELPRTNGGGSGYYWIALAKSGFDLYVCFCDVTKTKVYIEKTTTLNPNKYLCIEDLQFVKDEEFSTIHKFFVEKGILDG